MLNLTGMIELANGLKANFSFIETAKGPSNLQVSYPERKATPEERREICDIVNQKIVEARKTNG